MKLERGLARWCRGTELLLWIVAALCLSIIAVAACVALHAHRMAERISPQMSAAEAAAVGRSQAATQPEHSAAGVIGRLEIPSLRVSVPITSGIDNSSLLRGVGHVQGTAMPGGLGTLGLAGHRDTYLRPLRRIQKGMQIQVIDATGTYRYAVDSTEIVKPEQVNVLATRSRPELALITCYPFFYVGAAPLRFVVHAHLLSVDPEGDAVGAHGR